MRPSLLLKPEVTLAALLFVIGVAYFLGGLGRESVELRQVELQVSETPETSEVEVQLVHFDANGLEVPSFVSVEVPQDEASRYAAILEALRQVLIAEDIWPQELPAPEVFLPSVGRSSNLVLDFRLSGAPGITVEAERLLLDSIEATLAANGMEETSYLQNGQ